MIEGPQAQVEVPKTSSAPALRRAGDVIREALAAVARRIVPGHREADVLLWNLRIAYRVLWVALAGFGAYVVFELAFVHPKPKAGRVLLTSTTPLATPAEPKQVEAGRSLPEYLETLQRRNPFTGESGETDHTKAKTSKRRLDELTGGLVVVGIDRGPNPVALIEDTAQQRTYVVKIGDQINSMLIKRIGAEGVVVSYEGEELVLP